MQASIRHVFPSRLATQCLQEFRPNSAPTVGGARVVAGGGTPEPGNVVLAPTATERATRLLTKEFAQVAGTKHSASLQVTALCASGTDDALSLDAAFAYIAHRLSADLLVLNAEDLADPESVLGQDFCTSMSTLFSRFNEFMAANAALHRHKSRSVPGTSECSSSSSRRNSAAAAAPSPDPPLDEAALTQRVQYAKGAIKTATADASAALQAFLCLSTPLHSPRRRILYLRNFPGMHAVFMPLVHALRCAIDASPMPVLVVVGIWPVERLHRPYSGDDERSELLTCFHDLTLLDAHVRRKYSPELRAPQPGCACSSLADIFTAALQHSYGVPVLQQESKGYLNEVCSDTTFLFRHVLPIGTDPAHPVVQPRLSELRTVRVLSMNLPGLRAALRGFNVELEYRGQSPIDEWNIALSSSGVDRRNEAVDQLVESILSKDDLAALAGNLAGFVPEVASLADVLVGIVKHVTAVRELSAPGIVEHNKQSRRKLTYGEAVKLAGSDLKSLIVDPTLQDVGFDNVCVPQQVSDRLRSLVLLPLLYPQMYSSAALGEPMDGVLLHGPPGTGKTMMCCALARDQGLNMLLLRPSDIERMYVGESEQRIRDIFELARKLTPCIIFIDEMDALLSRHGDNPRKYERTQLTEFLQEMDGLKSKTDRKTSRVIVIGATNRPFDVDDAILRRLPCRIFVDLPGKEERKKILLQYIAQGTCDASINVDALVLRTRLFSGSDLKDLVRVARENAFRDVVPDPWANPAPPPPTDASVLSVVLSARHFDQAFKVVGATCRTNMRNLARLRRFASTTEEKKRSLVRRSWDKAQLSMLALRRQISAVRAAKIAKVDSALQTSAAAAGQRQDPSKPT